MKRKLKRASNSAGATQDTIRMMLVHFAQTRALARLCSYDRHRRFIHAFQLRNPRVALGEGEGQVNQSAHH
jgi:hypothetical protein